MTQGDKELLLKDLCARLPYNVIVSKSVYGHKPELYYLDLYKIAELQDGDPVIIKPYLRPMSSMTDKEKREYEKHSESDHEQCYELRANGHDRREILEQDAYTSAVDLDWLNKNHFDYRGLIEKGLAIEVTEENNPYK